MFLKTSYVLLFAILISSCSKSPDIPLSELEPYWSSWKKYGLEGESGMFCKKHKNLISQGVIRGTMNTVNFDANGMQVPPTKPGSKLFFETEGCELGWINGIRIEARERLVFNIAENGLFHNSGKGKIIFKDGRSIEF